MCHRRRFVNDRKTTWTGNICYGRICTNMYDTSYVRFDVFTGAYRLYTFMRAQFLWIKSRYASKNPYNLLINSTQTVIATGCVMEWNDFGEIIYITRSRLLMHTKMAAAATFPGDKQRVFSRDSLFQLAPTTRYDPYENASNPYR